MRILHVEDTELFAEYISKQLTSLAAGIEVYHILDLDEVVESPEMLDVCLLDLHLPHSDGIETLHKCSEKYPDLPIVVLSSDDSEELIAECLKEGADEYFVKSAKEPQAILTVLRVAFEKKAQKPNIRESTLRTERILGSIEFLKDAISKRVASHG